MAGERYESLRLIDTHTGGEPTRVIISGGPDPGGGSLAERRERFRREFDHYRRAAINEPRGSDVMVGALLCEPSQTGCVAGVIFFNNVGYLGMCGHGTIGVAAALAHLERIKPGPHTLDTPVGPIDFHWHGEGRASFENVPSYRLHKDVAVTVGDHQLTGDVAWGGNWFFLAESDAVPVDPAHLEQLTDYTWRIRQQLEAGGIAGANGAQIDHIELFSPTPPATADSRSFVLCPGKAYDRSPCGTGTSAKLACLAADGRLQPGETWVQESVIGSRFEASYRLDDESTDGVPQVIPRITGSAYVTAETTILIDPADPFAWGIPGR